MGVSYTRKSGLADGYMSNILAILVGVSYTRQGGLMVVVIHTHPIHIQVGLSSMRPHSKRSQGGGGEVGPNPNPPSEARVLPRNISEISVSELDDWVVVKTEKVKVIW